MSSDGLRHQPGDALSRMLGLLSVVLAAGPLTRPGDVLRVVGIEDARARRAAATAVGLRELVAGAGLLGTARPVWLWARVGGDAMDLAMLRRAAGSVRGTRSRRTAAALAAVAGITLIDLYAAVRRSGTRTLAQTGTITVGKPPSEVYTSWRKLSTLPAFMAHLEDVRVTGPRTSHWRTAPVAGRSLEWDAEIVEEVPGERLSWRSAADADIRNEGSVRFQPAPGGRGTEIHVSLRYAAPGGRLGRFAARLIGEDPRQQLDDDLRRFKQVAETGEIVRSEGAPSGKRAGHEFPQRPARPLDEDEREELLA